MSCSARLTRLGYYDGATELYEYGWAESFHFSRFYKGEGFHQSVSSHPVLSILQKSLINHTHNPLDDMSARPPRALPRRADEP